MFWPDVPVVDGCARRDGRGGSPRPSPTTTQRRRTPTGVDRFLDAFAAFADARLVGVPEHQQEHASWKLFAEMVQAATGYE